MEHLDTRESQDDSRGAGGRGAEAGSDEAGGAELLRFLSSSPTPYHAAAGAAARLREHGFAEIDETERWRLEPGRAYALQRAGSAIVAFRVGTGAPADSGFRILAAHLDSPALKLKVRGTERFHDLLRVPVEVYGGPILSTWLDRDLGIAGRLMVRSRQAHGDADHSVESVLVRTDEPVAIIPNLAIHLNRELNKGFEYNPQDHLAALVNPARIAKDWCDPPERAESSTGSQGRERAGSQERASRELSRFPKAAAALVGELAENAAVELERVLSWDLMLWDTSAATTLGSGERLYAGGRLDNLVGAWSALEALVEAEPGEATQVVVLFDAEEIGSKAGPGADSSFLEGVLGRIVTALGGDSEDYYRAAARSLLVSNDAAHALHPGYAAKYDGDYAPVLGGGPAIKLNAKLRYATSTSGAARVEAAAEQAGVPLQYLAVRSDMRSGSTIGPFGWARTGIDPVDIGVPIIAMHSIRETGDLRDAHALVALQRRLLEM